MNIFILVKLKEFSFTAANKKIFETFIWLFLFVLVLISKSI